MTSVHLTGLSTLVFLILLVLKLDRKVYRNWLHLSITFSPN
ncbi:uncharacterized, partial [Tachysurus ichikawai]